MDLRQLKYFVQIVESGSLTVHYEDDRERIRIAMVGAGSLLGEGAFFSHLPRSATVNAGGHSRLWCLTPLRFRELSTRYPVIALELTDAPINDHTEDDEA